MSINIYQLSGVDDRERGFSRQIEVSSTQGLSCAVLRYETVKVTGDPSANDEAALQELIHRLQVQGYTQLRTQLIFRGTQYLGSQEMWVDYPDPNTSSKSQLNPFVWIRRWFSFFGLSLH